MGTRSGLGSPPPSPPVTTTFWNRFGVAIGVIAGAVGTLLGGAGAFLVLSSPSTAADTGNNFPDRFLIADLPDCTNSPSRNGRQYIALDPVDTADATVGGGTEMPHAVICDGATGAYATFSASASAYSQISLEELGGGTTDVAFAAAGVFQKITAFDLIDHEDGGSVATVNALCTAAATPFACCTGLGTGTCGDITLPVGRYGSSVDTSSGGSNNMEVICCLFDDGVQTRACSEWKYGTGDILDADSVGHLLTIDADSEMDLRCQADSTGDIDFRVLSVTLIRVAA